MQLELRNIRTTISLIVIEVALFLAATVWVAKTFVAYELSETTSVKNLELAVRLDPNDAEYHLKLGRLYQYSMADSQPQRAVAHFLRAAELNPYNPEIWLELGAAMEFQGKVTEAKACLQRADSLAPNIPSYQWPLANFFLLQGNVDEALRHFRAVLAGTPQYDQIVFRTAWKATDDPEKILNELIPPSLRTEFSYLYYLVSQQRFREAQPVWKRIVNSSEKFNAQQCAAYMDALIDNRRPAEAYQVWLDLGRRGLVRSGAQASAENLVTNGDFEEELQNMGFGWRISPVEGVYAGLDTTNYHSSSHALRVQFSGKQNLDYWHTFQEVKVEPARSYRLQAFVRTEGITTDSGVRLEVVDPYDPAALDVLTTNMIGSSESWESVGIDFKTSPKTELVLVRLRRFPSQKLDNQIAGSAWLDDVRLAPLPR